MLNMWEPLCVGLGLIRMFSDVWVAGVVEGCVLDGCRGKSKNVSCETFWILLRNVCVGASL